MGVSSEAANTADPYPTTDSDEASFWFNASILPAPGPVALVALSGLTACRRRRAPHA